MAEQNKTGGLTPVPQPTQPLPGSEQGMFRSEMFGFKRDEVLAAIEQMARQNQQQQQQLDDAMTKLRMQLAQVQEEKQTLERQL